MPYIRVEKKKSGSYIRILESYRDELGKSTHRILYSLGKVEDYTPEQLRAFGIKLYELGGGEIKNMLKGEIKELGRYNYGYQMIYSKALTHFGLNDVFRRIAKKSNLSFDFNNTLLLMILERLQEPGSKRSNYLNQEEYLNLPDIKLHHLYRSLDKLDVNSDLIQQHIYHTGRDLFNTKLDVVFYDVTTFYFESDVVKDDELRQMGFGKDGKIGHTLNNPASLKAKQRRYFIKQTSQDKYELDQVKIDEAARYDGFLAIATNTNIPITKVLDNYKQLFKIEHSFRTFKSHLETRPMFHWTDTRIKGHICLCYIAFCLQNYVLQKINSTSQKISESILRKTLDKMQVSLIQTASEELYINPHQVSLNLK